MTKNYRRTPRPAAARSPQPKIDQNLIYPGKDFDNVFPEEGSDEPSLHDRQMLMNEIIECCAQVADKYEYVYGSVIAAAIRALKDKPCRRCRRSHSRVEG